MHIVCLLLHHLITLIVAHGCQEGQPTAERAESTGAQADARERCEVGEIPARRDETSEVKACGEISPARRSEPAK